MATSPTSKEIKPHTGTLGPAWTIDCHLEAPVKLIVGSDSDNATFYLPPTLLKSVSAYFRACLDGSFVEAASKEIRLKDITHRTFRHFVTWLDNSQNLQDLLVGELSNVWIMADSILCVGLQNLAMDLLRDALSGKMFACATTLGRLQTIDGKTADDSLLRSIWFDKVAFDLTTGPHLAKLVTTDAWTKLPDAITKELFVAYDSYVHQGKAAIDPASEKGCRYYVHEDGKPCAMRESPRSTARNFGSAIHSNDVSNEHCILLSDAYSNAELEARESVMSKHRRIEQWLGQVGRP